MIELDFAIETLANARAFLQLEMRNQWIYRILLARLYYAAPGLMIVFSIINHQSTINNPRLRRRRIQADYELYFIIRDGYMNEAVVLFADYLNACQQILGVT
jgi:hypothetical protein